MNEKENSQFSLTKPPLQKEGEATEDEQGKGRTASTKEKDQPSENRTPKSFGTPCHVR